jgi:hypothetical protein
MNTSSCYLGITVSVGAYINLAFGIVIASRILKLCSVLHEEPSRCRALGKVKRSGVFTVADALAVFAGCKELRLTPYYSFLSKSLAFARVFIFI